MINKDKAKEIIKKYEDIKEPLDRCTEFERAFVFGSSKWDMMIGPSPFVVMKDSGKVFLMQDAPGIGKCLDEEA